MQKAGAGNLSWCGNILHDIWYFAKARKFRGQWRWQHKNRSISHLVVLEALNRTINNAVEILLPTGSSGNESLEFLAVKNVLQIFLFKRKTKATQHRHVFQIHQGKLDDPIRSFNRLTGAISRKMAS